MKFENEALFGLILTIKKNNMKILLVEDNKEIAENVKSFLELEDYKIDTANSWTDGIDMAFENDYDMFLLDINLPWIDGINLAKKIKSKLDKPIIMLTARDSIDDKILGLNSGADDYVVKPYDLRELVARIESLTRRISWTKSDIFEVWDLKVDLSKRKFVLNWSDVKITQKEFLIMEFLIKNRWKAVSRTDIIEYIWWSESIFWGDWKLDVYISNLRTKLWKDVIKTVKWFWYEV